MNPIPFRLLAAAALALALGCGSALAAAETRFAPEPRNASEARTGLEQRGPWRTWDAGLREARERGMPVVVNVFTDWCGWCRRMDRDVLARAEVREALQASFVPVRLNAESEEMVHYGGRTLSARAVAARFRVTGYPTTVFLRPTGEHIVNVPGYVPTARFLTLLRYIGEGHMDRGVAFEEFAKR
jgi:thioredoxin-related protein